MKRNEKKRKGRWTRNSSGALLSWAFKNIRERLSNMVGFGESEEIDDGTLSPEVPSSISPRPPGRLEWNADGRGWNEALKAGNSCEMK